MNLIANFKLKTDTISDISLHTNKLGLARSLLAFGTLSSFLFNDLNNLFALSDKSKVSIDTIREISYTLFNLLGENNLLLAKIICITVLTLVILGIYPKLTCIPHWYISWSYFNSTAIIDGGDQITTILVFLLIPICLSDNRKNHWSKSNISNEEVSNKYVNILNYGFYTIIRIQVSLLYFEAAIGKFKVDEWNNGTSVYYWLNQAWFGAPNYIKPIVDVIIENKYGVTILTWGVIVFELILFMGLFMSYKRRRILLFFGVVFHFSFLVLLGLFSFYFAMFGALVLYLGNIQYEFNFQVNKLIYSR
jgi:antimicrobial peptide system SdpB family protein